MIQREALGSEHGLCHIEARGPERVELLCLDFLICDTGIVIALAVEDCFDD